MRQPRIVEEGAGYYFVTSRVVDRRFVFADDLERERVVRTMRVAEAFCGVKILTHAVLSNHFHCLVYVPERQAVADAEFGRRMGVLYDRTMVKNLMVHIGKLREDGQHEAAEAVKAKYTYRMYSLPEFMKALKQRVSMAYNKSHGRVGTLWEERYKSVLVEGKAGALGTVAAYIDLNPVRAGMVSDPKDYRHSGYGEAMGGGNLARSGLVAVLGEGGTWDEASGRYRQLLYTSGEARGVREDGKPVRPGFSAEVVEKVMEEGGKLPLNEVLRCRVRYFTAGAILGTREFVEAAFARHRSCFGEKRTTGARRMVGADWGELFAARELRKSVIGPPAVVT
jgi:putative transposase